MKYLIKIWNSNLIKTILVVLIILFVWLWITKPKEVVYPDKTKIELLKKQIANREQIIKRSGKLYDSLVVENKLLSSEISRKDSMLTAIKRIKKRKIKAVVNQTLQQDVKMFNEFTSEQAVITPIKSVNMVLISPGQLKQVNIAFTKLNYQQQEIEALKGKIELLTRQKANLKAEIKQRKKDRKQYEAQISDLRAVNDELRSNAKKLKKLHRKQNWKRGVGFSLGGAAAGLILGILIAI